MAKHTFKLSALDTKTIWELIKSDKSLNKVFFERFTRLQMSNEIGAIMTLMNLGIVAEYEGVKSSKCTFVSYDDIDLKLLNDKLSCVSASYLVEPVMEFVMTFANSGSKNDYDVLVRHIKLCVKTNHVKFVTLIKEYKQMGDKFLDEYNRCILNNLMKWDDVMQKMEIEIKVKN